MQAAAHGCVSACHLAREENGTSADTLVYTVDRLPVIRYQVIV